MAAWRASRCSFPKWCRSILRKWRASPARADELAELGLVLEPFGPDAVMVRETPALLGQIDVRVLLRDLADELAETGIATSLKERLDHVAATLACHTSRALRAAAERRRDERAAARNGSARPIPASAITAARPMWS